MRFYSNKWAIIKVKNSSILNRATIKFSKISKLAMMETKILHLNPSCLKMRFQASVSGCRMSWKTTLAKFPCQSVWPTLHLWFPVKSALQCAWWCKWCKLKAKTSLVCRIWAALARTALSNWMAPIRSSSIWIAFARLTRQQPVWSPSNCASTQWSCLASQWTRLSQLKVNLTCLTTIYNLFAITNLHRRRWLEKRRRETSPSWVKWRKRENRKNRRLSLSIQWVTRTLRNEERIQNRKTHDLQLKIKFVLTTTPSSTNDPTIWSVCLFV